MKRSIALGLLAAVMFGLAPGLAGYTLVWRRGYSSLANNPAACANCHVMQGQ